MVVIAVMIGGAFGALARYGVSVLPFIERATGPFPVATFLVNVVGCFVIGLLAHLRLAGVVPPVWYLALGTGFSGAFTTFSTFELEADGLYRQGAGGMATVYVVVSLAAGYLALVAGRAIAGRIVGEG